MAQNPGDQTPVIWFDANQGVTDTGNEVDQWDDQSASGFDATATTTTRPTLQTNQINSYPSLDFDGDDFMDAGDVMDFDPGVDAWSFFSVFNVGTGNTGTLLSRGTGGTGTRQYQYYISANEFRQVIGGSNNAQGTAVATGAWTLGSAILSSTTLNSYVNGTSDDPGSPGTAANQNTNVIIGARSSGTGFILTGEIAEIVMYNSALSASNQRDVETYLALKYGLTIDISSTGYTVGGTDIYTGSATFDNDIFGIGQDDSQGLDQTTSQSANTGGILSLSGATSQDDGDFLIMGHNNGTASTLGGSYNGGTTNGSNRIWLVEEVNEIGTVTITVNQSDLPSNVTHLYVNNNDASLGTGGTLYALVDGGSTWTVSVDLEDNDNFSFVTSNEMSVSGNSTEITDGDTTPSVSDDTDFGSVDTTTGTNSNVFTINNTGTGNLTLGGSPVVSISGTHSSDFTVTSQASTPVAGSGSTTFTIEFDPGADGLRTATVSIDNDDTDENPYNFNIQGTGASLPEMSVEGNSVEIVDGDNTPSTADDTDYGNLFTGTLARVFTIVNDGTATLNLSGSPIVAISGSSDFSISVQPSSTVASGGGTTTFTVLYTPTSEGTKTATISITNDDTDENPYTFDVSGSKLAAPGGIDSNLSLWLKADAGVSESGNAVFDWADQSGNGNDATQATGAEQPTLVSSALNGNPAITFDGTDDDLSGSAGFYLHDYFIVVNPNEGYTSTSEDDAIIGWNGDDFNGVTFGSHTGQLTNEVLTHSESASLYRSGVISTSITYSDPMLINYRNNSGATNQELYIDGSSTTVTTANTFTNLSDVSYTIGSNDVDGDPLNGQIAEVISYSSRLSDSDRRDVSTYLAIKYGLTLDISSQDYTVGGSSIYTHNSYTNDIAGIGQDDSQGLTQASSQSINSDAIVSMGNAGSLGDGDFLVWGNDDGATTLTTSNVPGGVAERMERIWRVDLTNSIGTVDVTFDISSLPVDANSSTFNLITAATGASMPTGLSTGTVSSAGTVAENSGVITVTFSSVLFSDGDFFTLGGTFTSVSPGDVSSGLSVWLKADKGVTQSGGTVTDWVDQSGNGNSATQINSGEQPTLSADQLNGNNAVIFDGTDDDLQGSAGFYTHDYFVVMDPDEAYTSTSGDDAVLGWNGADFNGLTFGSHTGQLTNEVLTHSISTNNYRSGIISTVTTFQDPILVNFRNNSGGTNQELYVDGASTSVTTANAFVNVSDVSYSVGSNDVDDDPFNGKVAEVISFSSRLSDSDRRDVSTYLAIKYGITLDLSADYTVGGSSIYTHNSYTNDIAGIGQNDSQGLNQTTSQSINSGSLVEMSAASDLADGEYFVWGNDGGSTALTTSNVPGGVTERLTRIWRVDETGDVGTVTVVFDVSSLSLNTNASTLNLIIATSGSTMPTGLSSATVSSAGTFSQSEGRTIVTFTGIDLGDDEFFTLGGTFSTEAPGGISSGLSIWLRADRGTTESSGTITSWADQSGNGNDATQATTSDQPTLVSDALNGNAAISFDGTDDDLGGSAGMYSDDYFIVVDPNEIYSSTSGDDCVLGWNGADFNGVTFGSHTGNLTNEVLTHSESSSGYRSGVISTSITYSSPMLINFRNNSGATNQELYLDGSSTTVTTANTFTQVGDVSYSVGSNEADDDPFNGNVAEIISFDTRLSDANRRDVATYLALKYGLTLDISSQNYTVGGSSIYSHSSYSNNIAGIGQGDNEGIFQESSTSEISGAAVTISNASSLADGDYLVWGNDGTANGITTSNIPGGVTNRVDRIWRVDHTNDVGTVDVAFNLSALALDATGTYNLIIATSGSTMPTGLSSASVSSAGSVSTVNGVSIVTFTGVTLSDDEYFTLAGTLSQSAPGDISSNLSLWLRADKGVATTGSNVTDWIDQSGNSNSASQTTSASQPEFVSDALNGNPGVSFDGSNTMIGDAGFYTHEYIVVLDPNEIYNNINAVGRIIGFEPGNFSNLSLGPSTFAVDDEIITHAIRDTDEYRSMQVSTSSNFGNPSILASHNNGGATAQEIDRNGTRIDNTEVNAGTFSNLSDQGYQLGEAFSASVSAQLNGTMLELISYSSTLSSADRRDVLTYLAIKYGISLDISSLDYTVGGSSIYNHSSYGTDISGIGINDSQCLSQNSSQSVNDGSIVKVSSASDLADGEYLVWGNDDGANTFTTSNVPSGVIQRLEKIWRLDETGDVGTVTISFDLTSLGIDVSNTTMNLIISPSSATMPTDLATGTLVTGGTISTVNGRDLVTFTSVNFSDGDFFTIGGDVQTTAPGGVASNLALWLRADDGITESSNDVSNWSDKSGNGNDAFQGNSSSQPSLTSDNLNYHDVVSFNNEFLEGAGGFNTHDYFVVLTPESEVGNGAAFGYAVGFSQRDDNGLVLGAETGLLTNEVVSHITSDASSNTYASGQTSTTVTYSVPTIFNSKNNSGATGQELYANGTQLTVTEANAGNFTNYSDNIYVLGDNISNSSSYTGNIAEVISYSARLSDSDRRDVSTYLAIRYGITLDISSESYTEGGTAIYNNTSYANDIAGIGQNLDNGMLQTQSISINSGSIVKIENASDLDDGEYVIWGNDGSDKTGTQTTELASGYDQRLGTEWQVDVTGSPGTVTVKIYTGSINGFGALSQAASSYTLLIDDDNDFSADLVSTTTGSTLSNDTLEFTSVSFSNNNYFTLAMPVAPSPGDVGTNLTLWLKADSDVTESSNSVSDWTDQSGNDNDAAQGSSSLRPTFTSGALNGNPIIDFDGSDDELGGITGAGFYTHDYFIVFSPDNTVSNGSSAEAVIGFDTGSDNGLYLGSSFGSLTDEIITHYVTNGGTYARAETSSSTTRSGYMLLNSRNNSGATQQELYLDGTQIDDTSDGSILNLSNVDYTLGDRMSGGLSFDGKIAEVISYSARISTDADRRDIATYLAVKYGITLDISGSDPFDAYTVEGAEIYDRTSYANDIAGIGVNGSQELNQTSSISINSDAIVTVGSATALSDGDYIVWGNDNGATGTTTSGLPSGTTERMTRVWGVNETGDAGTTTVTMDLTGLGYSSKVVGDFRLILDTDTDFTNGVSDLVTPQSFTSDVLTFSGVDFTSVTHFGLSTEIDITADTDTDGIPDYFETAFGTDPGNGNDPVSGGAGGTDSNSTTGVNGDGISDALETILDNNGAAAPITIGTDTDGDGIPDYLEVTNGTDPFDASSPTSSGSADSDSDGIPDALEALIDSEGGPSDPGLTTDTDGDGIVDYFEVISGTDPNDSNDPVSGGGSANDSNNTTGSSGDGISDALENILIAGGAASPVETSTDTDGDGIPDYIEAQTMSDPFNSASPAASGTPDVRSLQADYEATGGDCTSLSGYQWVDITDNLGNLVFSINPVGNNLGSTCWAVRVIDSSDDQARNDGTDFILDRNWYIIPTTQPSSEVYVRFYSLTAEHTDLADELLATAGFTYSDSDLRITKISGIDDLDPFVSGGTRTVLNPTIANYSTNGRSLTIGITSFSTFDPHVNPGDPEAALPITLLSFDADYVDGNVLLSWATASEINNDFFTIERSLDGVNFEEIATMNGAGNSNSVINYQYLDKNPYSGTSFYRLKQTDFDGQFSYSEIERVDNNPDHLIWSYYPNPTSGNISVNVNENLFDGLLTVNVTDLAGKRFNVPYITGSNRLDVDFSELVPGVYILEVEANGIKNATRVIKK